MKLVLGVDAGNSKTVALIARLDGSIVGYGRAGCGDIYNAGSPEAALHNVDTAIKAAMRAAGCRKRDLLSATFNMAGADWADDFAVIRAGLEQHRYAKRIEVVNDAVGGLRAGALDDWGVGIVNGTGAAVCARGLDGQTWHSSFWQDGGGGFGLGQNALRLVYKSALGIIGPTALTAAILSYGGFSTVDELLQAFTERVPTKRFHPARLSRTVLDVAASGDPVARELVRQEGRVLGDYALVAARKVGISQSGFPLILLGSVFKHDSSLLVDAVLERIQEEVVLGQVLRNTLEPCAGALVMALEMLGIKSDAEVRSNFVKTMPPPEFFET